MSGYLQRNAGFTLMELIGVMAILAILAAVLAPSLTDGIDRAYAAREAESLKNLSEALEQHVLTSRSIPRQTPAVWSAAVASYTDLGVNDVLLNPRGFRRAMYVDPQFFSATEVTFPGYTQNAGVASRPFSPRIMLVSDLTRDAPGAPSTAAGFAAIWDQTAGAGVVEGDKVKVARLNLAGRFHRLLLVNSSPQQPAFALEGGSVTPVPGAVGGVDGMIERYVLDRTQLSVFFGPFPAGGLNTRTLVGSDIAFHYRTDGTAWYWERS